MTTDEAIEWCVGKNVRITFSPSTTPTVQAQVQLQSPGNRIVPMYALRSRLSFVEAIEALQTVFDGVAVGTISVTDPSRIDRKLPPSE